MDGDDVTVEGPVGPPAGEALDRLDREDAAEERRDLLYVADFMARFAVPPDDAACGEALRDQVRGVAEEVRACLREAAPAPAAVEHAEKLLREGLQILATLRTLGQWQSPVSGEGSMVYHRQIAPLDHWYDLLATGSPFVGARAERAMLFSSFSGALTTWLVSAPPGPVLLDQLAYFEIEELVGRAPLGPITRVDPRTPGALQRALEEVRPTVVLLDLAPNSPGAPVTDLREVRAALDATEPGPKGRFTLLDHSLLGPWWAEIAEPRWPNDVLAFGRSLQKYDQRGFDLAAGGCLLVYGADARQRRRLVTGRGLTGSEMPVHSRWLLERPTIELHRARRLRRFRNGRWIVGALQRSHRWPGAELSHASDPSHALWRSPRPRWVRCPTLLYITVPPEVGRLLEDAETFSEVVPAPPPIALGASFGFRRSRVSWWGIDPPTALRVDVGLERASLVPGVIAGLSSLLDRLWTHAGL